MMATPPDPSDIVESTNVRSWRHTSIRKDHNFMETYQMMRNGTYTLIEDIRKELPKDYDFRDTNESNGTLVIRYISWASMDEFIDIIEIHGLSHDEIYLLSNEIVIPKERLE